MYPGGGFIGLLGRHKLNSRSALDKLVQMKWFDRKTRAVFIEFTLYSAHAGLFSTVQLMYFRTAKDIRTNYRVSFGLPPYYLRFVRNTFQLTLQLYPECTVQFHIFSICDVIFCWQVDLANSQCEVTKKSMFRWATYVLPKTRSGQPNKTADLWWGLCDWNQDQYPSFYELKNFKIT